MDEITSAFKPIFAAVRAYCRTNPHMALATLLFLVGASLGCAYRFKRL
ncbi:hypothetical protein [Caballeronia mineralivorans]|nr:hypothetical protein [Caballeronia mineralivorans]